MYLFNQTIIMKQKLNLFFINNCLVVVALFVCVSTNAQTKLKEVGNVKAVKIAGQNVSITTDAAFVEAMVYSPSIIRIRMDINPLKKDFSYAVIAAPLQTNATITQTANDILIVTDSLKVVVQKTSAIVRICLSLERVDLEVLKLSAKLYDKATQDILKACIRKRAQKSNEIGFEQETFRAATNSEECWMSMFESLRVIWNDS